MSAKPSLVEDIYPLTPAQEGMLFHVLHAPGSGMYLLQVSCRLEGELDEEAFAGAWQAVLDRHTILRSAFVADKRDEPFQVVYRSLKLPCERLDWRGLDPERQGAEMQALLERERARGLDPARPPLMRLALVRLGAGAWRFAWTHHHLILDGWSRAAVLREAFAAYEALRAGRPPEAPRPRPFHDYVQWLRRQDGAAAERYWRRALGGFRAPVRLGREAAAGGDAPPQERGRELSAAETAALQAFARRHDLTLYTLLQAAWGALLGRAGGETDVVFGAVSSGRPAELPGAERMVGLFIHTVPVRLQLDGDAPLLPWLAGLQAAQLEQRQHEHAPLAGIQAWSELPRGVPLFETLLDFVNYPVADSLRQEGGSLRITGVQHWERTNFPLLLGVLPGPPLRLSLICDPRRFDAVEIERLLGWLAAILCRLPADPQQRLWNLAPLGEAETHQVLHAWNDTALELRRDLTLIDLVEAQAARTPEAPALIHGEEVLTYRALMQRADRLAGRLRALGVGPEVRVGVCRERDPGLVVSLLAVLKAGGAYVPLDPAYPPERLRLMLEDSGAGVIIDRTDPSDRSDLSLPLRAVPRSLAYLIYTSGSTGRPKAVAIEHRSAVALVAWAREVFSAEDLAGVLCATSVCFDLSVFELFVPLALGGAVILAPDVLALPALPAAGRVTLINTVPSAMDQLAGGPLPERLRVVNLAGEPLPGDLVRRLHERRPDVRVYNLYGPSEDTTYSTGALIPPGERSPSIGRPLANARVCLVDPHGVPAPAGVPGEIWLGGEGLARGYLERPALTAERFVPDPFSGRPGERLYRTGDLARWRADGELEFLGRVDHQVKIRGFRVELGEIEAALREHPGVREAVVVAREHRSAGHRLVAYVAGGLPAAEATGALQRFLRDRLPAFMVPAAVVVLAALPRTPNGKVDRRALPEPEAARSGPAGSRAAPRDAREEALAGIWAAVLGVERVGIHDNFFELGGDSILSLQVVSRAARAGLRLTSRQLFDHPTVEGLAALLAEAAGEPPASAAAPVAPVVPPLDAGVRERLLAGDSSLEDVYPLAPVQQGMLFHALEAPGEGVYVQQISCALSGDLDPEAFAAAWRRVIARHPILRTRFLWEGLDAPLQAVVREAALPLERLDRSAGLPAGFLAADRRRGFDLARAPLLRLTLIDPGRGAWRLVWSHHHLLLDGWSVPRVLAEAFVLYERLRRGDASEPVPPRPYRDFIDWLARQDAAGAEAFWRRALAGFAAPTPLGVDRPRAAGASTGDEREVCLDGPLTDALSACARQQQVTPNTLLQGAWAVLLSRISGEDDVVFGGVTSGRPADLPGSAAMIGLFINTLPVRARPAARTPLGPWLRELQAQGAAQRSHEHTPLARVQGWSEVPRGLPLFETLLDFVNTPVEEVMEEGAEREPGLRVDEVRFLERTHYPLTLIALPGTRMRLRSLFDRGRFDGATVERLLGWLGALLQGMAEAGAGSELGSLPLLTPPERRQILAEWNDTAVTWQAPGTSLHALVEAQVDRAPEAPAVVFDGEGGRESLTYRELDERADRLAHRLRRLGAGPGMTVGVSMERSLEMVVALLAVLKAGAAYLPLDPSYPRERIDFMVEDSRAPVVLTRDGVLEALGSVDPESAGRPGTAVDPLDLAYVIYTSGSTGRPKGAMNTHEAIRNRLLWMQAAFGLTPEDRVLQKTPFSFDVSVWEFFWPLLTGARLVVARPGGHQDPAYLADVIAREEITTLHFVPSMLQAFVAGAPAARCASLRRVVCSGEALPPDLAERFRARFAVGLHNLYGPTEAAVDVTWWPCGPEDSGLVPIGRAIANTRLHVVDRALRPVPVGVPGELWLGGVQLARGYHGRPDLTAERFMPDPFGAVGGRLYRTGDLVRWLADGNVEYLGRIDHQVKIRGFRIEPGEIEAVLAAHPGVRQCVVAVRSDAGHDRLVAYVVPEGGETPGLRAWLAERLPEHMVPAAFVSLQALPLSPNGKVDRKALPAPGTTGGREEDGYVPPRTPLEQTLATLWAEVLRLERVGVRDNFFALGGDSILCLQIVSRAARSGLRLTPRQLFAQPTVAGLAALSPDETATEAPPAPLSPIVPPLDPSIRERLLAARPEVEDVYPLTPPQQGLLFHALQEPGSDLYLQQVSCVLRGDLDLPAFTDAWRRVVARHPVLRTAFVWEGVDRPLQLVAREVELPIAWQDDGRRAFDPERAPLLRLALEDLGSLSWRMVWSHHHLLLDGWSVARVLGEVFLFYERSRRGDLAEPERPRPYRDFVDWLSLQDVAGAEAFWRRILAGVAAPTPLGVDRPHGEGEGGGEEREVELPAPLTAALRSLARDLQVTLNTVFQGAWAALLARLSGEDDVVFGGVTAGRPADLPGSDEMIGLFINTLPVRVRVEAGDRIAPWLQALQEGQLEQRGHEHTPLAQVQGWSDVPRGLPLFASILDFLNYPLEETLAEGETSLRVEDVRFLERTNYPLTLIAAPGTALRVRALFDRGRLDGATVERLLGWLGALLEGMAAAGPEGELEGLPILTPSEHRQVLDEWNRTAVAWDTPGTGLHELVEAQVDRTPGAVAVVFDGDGGRLTYRELDEWANRLAHRLRRLGAGPGVPVGVCLERSPEMVVALLGILKAGGAWLPLEPALPRERIDAMVDDSQTPVVLTREIVREALDAECPERPGVAVDPLDLAYVIYTSGSTGRPKGTLNTHAGICNRLLWMQAAFGLTADDRVLQKTPFGFDVSVWEFFWPLLAGARLVVAQPGGHQDPAYLAEVIEREGITTLHFVPSMLQAFVAGAPAERCASLRRVFASGEALPLDLQERFFARFGAELHNLYGPTEAAVDVTWWPCERGGARGLVPIGRAIANTRLHVMDRALRPVPVGVAGELWLGGVQLARGYHGRPDLTAERFVPDPQTPGERLYRTGDLVRWLPDGAVEYLGRIDHQVKIRGVRIELGEIEAVLGAYPGVRQAVVVAREDAGPRRLVAYLVPESRPEPELTGLRAYLAGRLPEAMVPAAFVWLAALPLTGSGKVDRKALPSPEGRAEVGGEHVPPRTPAERTLAALWAEVLRVERVGVRDDFFALGGDSILSLQIVSRAGQAGLRLTPRQIFDQPTVEALAAAAVPAGTEDLAEQGPLTGPVGLTPAQRRFFADAPAEPWHFNQAVLLEVRERPAPAVLDAAVSSLLEHHDALRLRFVEEDGEWHQEMAAPGGAAPWIWIDLAALADRRFEAFDEATAALQASLDLENGPLLRAAVLDLGLGEPVRLLLVIHHLAVDGVSWRILLEDLESASAQAQAGRPRHGIRFPARTTSFRAWSRKLTAWAGSADLEAEIPFWTDARRRRVPPLPVDTPGGENTGAATESLRVELDRPETAALLREAPRTWRTRIDELLLAALVRACAGWTGEPRLLVELEGHGREELFAEVDLSRTVGWFTSFYPLLLDVDGQGEPGAAIRTVKEQLRAVPRRGLGSGVLLHLSPRPEVREALAAQPAPQVLFNYLGQLDSALSAAAFAPASESAGPMASPRQERRHLLEINAGVSAGRLWLSWTWSRRLHRRETVERLAGGFLAELRTLLACCLAPGAGGFTPSDFPLAAIGQDRLDRLAADHPGMEDLYPLSPTQQGLLFYHLYAPGAEAYVQQLTCGFRGDFDPGAFRRAWELAVERNPVLRTSFVWRELDEPLQVVHRSVSLPWREVDVRHLSADERRARFEAFLREDRAAGLDLEKPPLARFHLFRLGEDEVQLVWTWHHILLDGWSLGLLFSQVLAAYEALAAGRPAEIRTGPPYRDYIAWLRRQDMAAAEEHWREILAGLAGPTRLAADRGPGRLPGREMEHAGAHLELPEDATEALQTAARRSRLTVSTLVQGAWAALLALLSGDEEVVFGVTSSGRPAGLPGVEKTVGLFITTLPARVPVPADAPLLPWLTRLQEGQLRQRQLEFVQLAQVQAWSGLPASQPLFDSILVFENYPAEAGLRDQTVLEVPNVVAFERTSYALTAIVTPGRRLSIGLGYDRRRFGSATVERALSTLGRLLEGMAGRLHGRLSDLPLLSEVERHQVLIEHGGRAAAGTPLEILPVHALFAAQAARTPEHPAVVGGGRRLTYGELDRRSAQLAGRLRRLGVGPEVRVAVCLRRSCEMIAALLAVLRAGGAYVPIDPAVPRERLAFLLEDSGAAVLLTESALADRLPDTGTPVVLLDDAGTEGAEWASGGEVQSAAYVIYTSGSTGLPKGVVVSHEALARYTLDAAGAYRLGPDDRVLQFASISFDASAEEIYPALARGATLVLRGDPVDSVAELLRQIEEERLTVLDLPTAYWHSLVAGLDGSALSIPSSVRLVILGGEQALAERVETWRRLCGDRIELVNTYGPTEATIVTTRCRLTDDAAPPIGLPWEGAVTVVAGRALRPVPPESPGELLIGGAGLARGYLGRPALTAERFVPDPWSAEPGARLYRSGDRVRWLADGRLEFLGRLDDQVKVRGFRIEPGEIEAALARHPGLQDAAVVARREGLVAYVVPAGEAPPSAQDLRLFLAERLPDYMVPLLYQPLPALPLTPAGKVDRRSLPEPAGPAGERDPTPPRDPLEERLAGIWREVLGLDRVGVRDDFFALGGHSLLAVQVVSRVREALQVDLPLARLFEAPTVEQLAREIGAAQPDRWRIPRRERSGPARLSFAQERLWFLDRLTPGGAAYNLPTAVRFEGPLDVPALAAALHEIAQRHEVLRTTFGLSGGEPVQIVDPAGGLPLPVVDLGSLAEAARLDEARRLATAEARGAFDLERGPVARARLVRLAADDHALLVTLHHIAGDAWSLALVSREVAALYAAFSRRRPSPLPPLPLQYADYAAWQRERLEGGVLEEDLKAWRQRLEGLPTLLELPTDRPRPPVPSFRGAALAEPWPAGLSARIAALARARGCTVFMVLLAAFQTLLARWSGQDDVPVGTPTAGRIRRETEDLIGFFVNTLVLRGDLAGDPPFEELLERARRRVVEAQNLQEVPFEKLVEVLRPERNPSHAPLFQVMFSFESLPPAAPVTGLPAALRVIPLEAPRTGMTKFDLTVSFVAGGDGALQAVLEHSTDLWDTPTARRLLAHLRTLLDAAVADPARRLADLPLLAEAERHQLLLEWNDTRTGRPAGPLLPALLAEQAERTPEAVAVDGGAGQLTFHELAGRVDRLAARLRRRGVGPDVLVGVCLERSPELIVALLAVLAAGGAYLPLDPEYPAERLAFLMDDSRAPLLLTRDSLRDLPAEGPSPPDPPSLLGSHLAYVMYTSGSTGHPKGVMITHEGLVRYLRFAMDRYLADGAGAGAPLHSSIGFDLTVTSLFAPLLAGRAVVLVREEAGGLGLAAALRARSDFGFLKVTPPHLELLGRELAAGELAEWSGTLIAGGEVLTAAALAAWRAVAPASRVINEYGPTETVVGCAVHAAGPEPPASGAVPIGRPIDAAVLHLLDRGLRPVPVAVPGEICIGGPVVARGYLGRPSLTAERFIPDPHAAEEGARLYRTGDRARRRADGILEFLGRTDGQVKIRGVRIEPAEVEAALAAHPAVRQAVVAAREVAGDRRLVAWLVAAGEPCAEAELRDALRRSLPAQMIPAAFVWLPALPLNAHGKVDRRALPSPEPSRREARAASVPPRTDREWVLARLWAELLGVEQVGVHDDFFALGGHSMLAVRLLARVQRIFHVSLPLRTIFELPTVAGLDAAIEREFKAERLLTEPETLVELAPGGPEPPLFLVAPMGSAFPASAKPFLDLARLLAPRQAVYGVQPRRLSYDVPPAGQIEERARLAADAIRALPEPPRRCRVGGWSSGGPYAWELAHQLEAHGIEVLHIVMFDCPAPHPHRPGESLRDDEVLLLAHFACDDLTHYALPFTRAELAERLRPLPVDERFAVIVEEGKKAGALDAGMEVEDVRFFYGEFKTNLITVEEVIESYTPPRTARPVLVVRAGGPEVLAERDPALGWRRLTRAGVEVDPIFGLHGSIFDLPQVETLAERMQQAFDRGGPRRSRFHWLRWPGRRSKPVRRGA